MSFHEKFQALITLAHEILSLWKLKFVFPIHQVNLAIAISQLMD